MAQIAVRDEAEGVRAPSAAEAAALTGAPPDDGEVVALQGGGVALRASGAQLSMVVASRNENGTIQISHGAMPANASVDHAEGGGHAR